MAQTKELGPQSAANLRNEIIAGLEGALARGDLIRRDVGMTTLTDGRQVPARAYYSTPGDRFLPNNVFAQNTAVLDREVDTVSLSVRTGNNVAYAFLGQDNNLVYNGGQEEVSMGVGVEFATRRLLGQVTGKSSQAA